MRTRSWVILLIVLVALAFGLGYYFSTLKKAYDNRDKIKAGADIIGGLGTLLS